MKKRVLLLVFIFVIITLYLRATDEPSEILIKGHINKVVSGYVYLVESKDVINYNSYCKALDSSLIDTSGNFEFLIETKDKKLYQIRRSDGFNLFYKINLFLGPGDTLILSKAGRTIELKGNAAELNELQRKIHNYVFNDKNKATYTSKRYLEPEEFIPFINKMKDSMDLIIRNYDRKFDIPAAYYDYLIMKVHYQWVDDYFDYIEYHKYYSKGEFGYLTVDSLGYNFLKEWHPDSNFHYLIDYKHCINKYVDYLYGIKMYSGENSLLTNSILLEKFSIIKQTYGGKNREISLLGLSKNFWTYMQLMQDTFYQQVELVDNYFQNIKQSDKYYNEFKRNLNEVLSLKPGIPAPDFTLKDTAGNNVSLHQFKGKIVYITFWGTWCGPCINSIPRHLELHDKFQNNNDIVFIYIALEYKEDQIKRWKDFLETRKWPGIHLVAENQFHNKELAPYKINSAPAYVLIDKNGNIASVRAQGPEYVLEDIISLLNHN